MRPTLNTIGIPLSSYQATILWKIFKIILTKNPNLWRGNIKVAGNCMKWIDPALNLFPLWLLGSRRVFASWTKVAGNCMKWIEFFPSSVAGVGGLFYQLNQSCWKLHEMDRSSLNFFPFVLGGGGGICQLNQSCWNLHEMDRSSLKFPLFGCGGGGFSASWPKVAGNCMKWIDPVLIFFLFGCGQRGAFLPAEPKLLEFAWNG